MCLSQISRWKSSLCCSTLFAKNVMSLTPGANLPCNHSLSLIPINAANMFLDEHQVCVISYVSPLSNCFFFVTAKVKVCSWKQVADSVQSSGQWVWMVDLFHLVKSQDFCACHDEKHVQIVAQTVKTRWMGHSFAYTRCGFYINPKNRFIILFKESSMDMCTCKASMYTCMYSNMAD